MHWLSEMRLVTTVNLYWSIILAAREFEESMEALRFLNTIRREIRVGVTAGGRMGRMQCGRVKQGGWVICWMWWCYPGLNGQMDFGFHHETWESGLPLDGDLEHHHEIGTRVGKGLLDRLPIGYQEWLLDGPPIGDTGSTTQNVHEKRMGGEPANELRGREHCGELACDGSTWYQSGLEGVGWSTK